LAAIAGYLYVLKTPLQTLRSVEQTLQQLEDEQPIGGPLESQIAEQQKLNQTLNLHLYGAGDHLPANQMVVWVIAELDKVASRHQVTLGSVKPGDPEKVFNFHVLNFQVEITGSYRSLYAWLAELEEALGPIAINQFVIEPIPQSADVKMSLQIASYQVEPAQ
jgi:Tfp pilus assembly protein PilO